MTTHTAPQLAQATPSAIHAFSVISVPGKVALAAATLLAANDTVQLVKLPAFHVPVGLTLDVPDLDSDATPAILFRVGFIGNDAEYNDDDAFVVAGNTAGQGGGIVYANAVGFLNIAPAPVDRIIGITVNTAADAAPAGEVVIRASLLCRQQQSSLGD